MLIDQVLQAIKETSTYNMTVSVEDVKKCTDLACLEPGAGKADIEAMCTQATTGPVEAAGVCVFPEWVEIVRGILNGSGSEVKVASAINFPAGTGDTKVVRKSIDRSIMNGAQELDIVFPYQLYIEARSAAYRDFEKVYEHISKRAYTKVIIETGAFDNIDMIYDLTCGLLDLGVDMIKTSTGKHPKGPTMEAAAAILFAIKNHGVGAATGLKVAGGIRTLEDAGKYARLYQRIIGRDWRNRSRLRFGASQLIS